MQVHWVSGLGPEEPAVHLQRKSSIELVVFFSYARDSHRVMEELCLRGYPDVAANMIEVLARAKDH